VIENLVQLTIHAYYAGELEAGRRACDRALDLVLPEETEHMVRSNRTWYTQLLDELVDCRHVRIDVEPAHEGWSLFNPTIAVHDDRLLGIVRSSNYQITDGRYVMPASDGDRIRTDNLLVEFTDDLRVARCRTLVGPEYPSTGYPVTGLEDCRLRLTPRGLGVSATVRDVSPFDGRCRIGTTDLDLEAGRLHGLRVLDGLAVQEHEKNWMPFMGDRGGWLYAANHDDHVVTVDPTPAIPGGYQIARRSRSPILARRFRGGSQLVPYYGGWLGLIHEVAWLDGSHRAYEHRWVWLDHDLRLDRISPWFSFREPRAIEFAAGLAEHGDQLVVSYGVRDAEAWICSVDADDIWQLLSPVTSA